MREFPSSYYMTSMIMNDNRIIKDLWNGFVIWRPDKGGWTVVMKKSDYTNKVDALFNDRRKFKVLPVDPTPTRLNSLPKYSKKLHKRGENYQMIYPKAFDQWMPNRLVLLDFRRHTRITMAWAQLATRLVSTYFRLANKRPWTFIQRRFPGRTLLLECGRSY